VRRCAIVTSLPWTCPFCRAWIQQTAELPRTDRIYRCPICHKDMRFDAAMKKMQPFPPNDDDNGSKTRKVA
jgi:hypothetical protein